jgi:hypothetical protein
MLLGVLAGIGFLSLGEFYEFVGLDKNILSVYLMLGMIVLGCGLAMMLCVMVADRMLEREAEREANDDEEPQEGIPLCYSCLTPAEPHQHFCMNCWTPLTSHAEIDPLGRILATGDMYWKLTRGPQKPIALIGALVLLAPVAIGLGFGMLAFVYGLLVHGLGYGAPPLLSLDMLVIALGGLLWVASQIIYAIVLVKVIRNYCRQKLLADTGGEVPDDSNGDHCSLDS